MNNYDKIEAKDKKLFDDIAENYIKKDLKFYSRLMRKLRLKRSLRNIKKPINRLLEIGCGAGFSAEYLKNDYIEFIGVDYSEKLIQYANKFNKYDKTKFIAKNIKDFQTEQKFDVIFMIGVLHHIPDPEKVLNDLKTMLKPNGMIIANEPQRGNPIITLMRKIRKKVDDDYSSDQRELSQKELIDLFNKCGYEVKTYAQGLFSTPFAETTFLPSFIGIPFSLLSYVLDPIFETLFLHGILKKIAWNVVVKAKIK